MCTPSKGHRFLASFLPKQVTTFLSKQFLYEPGRYGYKGRYGYRYWYKYRKLRSQAPAKLHVCVLALSTSTVLVWLVPAVYTCTEKVLHCNVVGGDCQTYSVGWGAIIHSYLRNDLPLLISERSQHSAHA